MRTWIKAALAGAALALVATSGASATPLGGGSRVLDAGPDTGFTLAGHKHKHKMKHWKRGHHYGWYRGKHKGWYKHRRHHRR